LEQLYYTQEGKPYILKSVTKNFASFIPGSDITFNPLLDVNVNLPTINNKPWAIGITSPKKIIPLFCTFSACEVVTGLVQANISSPFYQVLLGNGTITGYYGVKAISKGLAMIDRLFFSNNQNYAFNIRYGQIVYSVDDFISPSSGLLISFTNNLANAITITPTPVTESIKLLNAVNYSTCVTFLYFELQTYS
jgi:hypothetical protein